MGHKYNIVKATTWYTIGNILIKGASFLVLPVFTSIMNTRDYGIFSIYLSYLAIFETLMLLGLSSTINIAKFTREIDFEKYVSTIVVIPIAFTMFLEIMMNIYMLWHDELLSLNSTMWNFLLVTAGTAAISNIICARLVIEGRYILYMSFSVLNTIGNIGISILLCYTVFRYHDTYMARIIGNSVANVVGMCFLIAKTDVKLHFSKEYFNISIKWGVPLLLHTIATVVLTQSDRIIIKRINGFSEAGIYSIAITIVTIPMVLQSSAQNAWTPWFYEKLDKKKYEDIVDLNDKYIILFAAIIAEFILICPEIVHFFTNRDYWNSVYCLMPLSISVFGELLYCFPVSVEYYNKKTTYILSGTVLAVIVNIILDVFFVILFGYVAAAYATAISKLLLFVFHYLLSKKIDNNAIFHGRIVCGSIVILVLLDVFATVTVDKIIIRLVTFLLIFIALLYYLLKNKNVLRDYMKS